MKKAFKKGLVKAAQTTDSIIVTNGSHSGVTKLVGEAVAENLHHKLNLIGVVTWGTVAYREKLEVSTIKFYFIDNFINFIYFISVIK